jgi:hypothetical protein
MCWLFHGNILSEEEIRQYSAFVYCITNTLNGRKYIGKKLTTKASYKTVNGERKKTRQGSDFMVYYGSNVELQEDVKFFGKDKFLREILYFCNSKSEATYLELREQIDRRVLETELYYNSWIMARIRKSNLGKLNEIV